jgi:hypothetical protein
MDFTKNDASVDGARCHDELNQSGPVRNYARYSTLNEFPGAVIALVTVVWIITSFGSLSL